MKNVGFTFYTNEHNLYFDKLNINSFNILLDKKNISFFHIILYIYNRGTYFIFSLLIDDQEYWVDNNIFIIYNNIVLQYIVHII